MADKLTRVTDIELDGEKYVVAKNGSYCLVRAAGLDAFGTEYFEVVSPRKFLGLRTGEQLSGDRMARYDIAEAAVQALIDKLGEALAGWQQARDMRARQGVGSGVVE